MSIKMVPVEIIGLKADAQKVIKVLQRVGCVHIEDIVDVPEITVRTFTPEPKMLRYREDLASLTARIGGLLKVLSKNTHEQVVTMWGNNYLAKAYKGIETLIPSVQKLINLREELESELASLPRYESILQKLLPIIPDSAQEPETVTTGVIVNREHLGVLDSIEKKALQITAGEAEIVTRDIDNNMYAMLIVFPNKYIEEIEILLGHKDVSRLQLPPSLDSKAPDAALASLRRRLALIPKEINNIDTELTKLSKKWQKKLYAWRAYLQNEMESTQILERFGETDLTFILFGWIPSQDIQKVETALQKEIGNSVYVKRLEITPEMKKRIPVILENPRVVRPFESLVNLISRPRYERIDPSGLVMVFLPLFFGMMLGDVAYGSLVILLALGVMRRRRFKTGIIHDLLIVLAMGGGWSILFGFLYGEFFGTFGKIYLGMQALWLDRYDPDHITGLLTMAITVGAVHIILGLVLGIREAIIDKSRYQLLERSGMLVGLIGLFVLVGVLTNILPQGFMSITIVANIIGIVLLSSSMGRPGIAVGPIEFISLVGNILSYIRIAAIGLASAYLAKVATEVAGMLGIVIVGAIIGILIHSLNLVLGMFSPTIQGLRLHYVEFFRKFYEGGGRAYEPFQSHLGHSKE